MRKKIAMTFIMVCSFMMTALVYAADTAAPQISGFETLARKVLGSGFVQFFIDGGWAMWPILFVAIYGIAYAIWKFISLNYAKINVSNFLDSFIPLIEKKNYKDAMELVKKTRGPIGATLLAGMLKADKGVPAVEKAIENAGIIEMAFLEKGFTELGTCISLAPMLGFLGTVAGMVQAFDAIARAGSVEPTIVASGIKVALITTVSGLTVAIPVQLLNNIYMVMVDGLVLDLQRATEKVMETLVEQQ
jgi:biopolymer transport protein ExbB